MRNDKEKDRRLISSPARSGTRTASAGRRRHSRGAGFQVRSARRLRGRDAHVIPTPSWNEGERKRAFTRPGQKGSWTNGRFERKNCTTENAGVKRGCGHTS